MPVTTTPEKPLDSVGFIIAYEDGELDDGSIITGFQVLIDNGMAWRLQGSYGRMAAHLIKEGHCIDTFGALDKG